MVSTVTILLKAILLKSLFTFVAPSIRRLNEIGFFFFEIGFLEACTPRVNIYNMLEIIRTKSHTTSNRSIYLKYIANTVLVHTFDVLKLTLICKTLGRNESIVEHGNNSLFTASSFKIYFLIVGGESNLFWFWLYFKYAHWEDNTKSKISHTFRIDFCDFR